MSGWISLSETLLPLTRDEHSPKIYDRKAISISKLKCHIVLKLALKIQVELQPWLLHENDIG